MICFAIGAGSLVVGVIIKIFPNALFNKIKLFREEEMDQAHMDRSFTSMMRRKSSVRMGTVQGRNFSRDSFSNKSWERTIWQEDILIVSQFYAVRKGRGT